MVILFFFFKKVNNNFFFSGKTVAIKQLNNPNQEIDTRSSSSSELSYSMEKSKSTSSFNVYTYGGQNINHESLNYYSEFQREAWLMSGIDSPYLVKLEGIVMDPLCLVMEYLPYGSLYQLIHDIEKYPVFEENFINKIALNIAQGMNVLHTSIPQVIHRDLKSPNVLVCSENKDDKVIVKVADFGLSRFSSGSFYGREVWNPFWLPPEIIANKEYNEKSDVYRYFKLFFILIYYFISFYFLSNFFYFIFYFLFYFLFLFIFKMINSFAIILWELIARTNPFSEFDREYKSGPMVKLEDDIVNGRR